MKPIRILPLIEHPDAALFRLVAETPSGRPPSEEVVRALAHRQAVTLEGLIAKAEHALAAWHSTEPADRAGQPEEAMATCLEQAIAALQALPVAPQVRRLGMPYGLRATARRT